MMSIDHALLAAREEFYERAWAHPKYMHYVRQHGLQLARINGFAGATGMLPVVDCGGGHFDFEAPGELVEAFICEALGEDGESVIDLVAWPVNRPTTVMSMFGRAPVLGLWEAVNPSTYFGGKALQMHRTPLEWLQSGCRGAAVVVPHLAARFLFDVEGPIAGKDERHRRQLLDLVRSIVDDRKIICTAEQARAA
ncbi:hypothetical protein [Devosia sp. 1566]|uniref:hypothetical protein n=1 Tax=Devosia sp. 1566 TaxID=2499144 RepID=UPI0019D02D21|nr:hypothetical protein [Devosia sp. 1566]